MIEKKEVKKIAFVGTSSIGKTTLIEELRKIHEDNPSIVFVKEAAREFFTNNPGIIERFKPEIQGKIQDLQLNFEKDAHDKGAEIIFCDRSVIDAVVYSRAYGDISGSDFLLSKVAGWLPTYERVFLLDPRDVPFVKDEIRQEEESVRQGFHDEFISFFAEKDIPYELLSGTIEQRLKRVAELIRL